MSRELMSRIRRSLWLVVVPALSGCSAVMVAGGPGFDAGSFGVSGVENGIGAHIEVIRYPRADSLGLGLGGAFELAGYPSGGDADPLGFTTFEVRYRRPFDTTAAHGAYWEIGSGGGIAWSAGIRAAAVPLQGEIGMQKQTGSVLLSIGLRERFLGLISSGSPPLDFFNSVQVVVGVRFGEGSRSRASVCDRPTATGPPCSPPAGPGDRP